MVKNNQISKSGSKVRVGLHSTNLMFGEVRKDGSFNYDGLDLSLSEQKALFAVQKLLDKTNYEGNAPAHNVGVNRGSFNYSGKLPRITFTPSEYLEAYGLEKRKTSRGYMEYSSSERAAALDALYNLSRRKFKIVYKRHRFEKGETEKIDRIETESELLRIYKGYFGLTAEEDKKLDRGGEVKKMIIGVEVCPLIVDQIDNYFILLDPHLHTNGRSKFVPLFIKWLTTQTELQRRNRTSGAEIKIGVDKLAGKLRIYSQLKQRKWKSIEKILEECLGAGRGMGLIDSFTIEEGMVKIALPINVATSTHKNRKLYPQNAQPLPIDVAEAKVA